ncbi:MAG: cation:proton antiporter [Planctomycetia bacterium]|nr:cation:proton antiporter [Planctomycetia bacterium]
MLAVAFATALVLGYVTQRLGLSPILGYLLAGIVLGPHTPGPVANQQTAEQLAEVGVILLMFGVGLHFHLKHLLAVKSVAIPGAIFQSAAATALGALLAGSLGWGISSGLVFGVGVSVASTVVLMRVLGDHSLLDSAEGHVAVGWLVVEDILTVLVLVALPVFAARSSDAGAAAATIGWAVLKLLVVGLLFLVAGARLFPWLFGLVARTRSGELFTLTVLVLALSIAVGASSAFGVSIALGAFLSGMVVGQSMVSHQAASEALPLRNAFAVLFFVSAGMLFNPKFILSQPLLVLGTLGIVLIGKPLAAFLLSAVIGTSFRTALTVSIGLAQIGEFSFILGDTGRRLNLLPGEAYSALVAGALLSIALNPLLFRAIGPLENWARRRKGLWKLLNRRSESIGKSLNTVTRIGLREDAPPDAVVVGYGPVGRTVSRLLRRFGLRIVVIDLNVDTITEVRSAGQAAIYGDAARNEVLRAAQVQRARYLVLTLPDLAARIPVIIAARELNPDIRVFVRAHYLSERTFLEEVGATEICFEEEEAAAALAERLLRTVGVDERRVAEEVLRLRSDLAGPALHDDGPRPPPRA